jgi:predicted nucleotide-binding protein
MDQYSPQPPSQSPAPSPILDRLRRNYFRGLEILKIEQTPRGTAFDWLRAVNGILSSLYGPTKPIVKEIREKALNIQRNGISREFFEMEVANLKGLINQMEYSAGIGALNTISTSSIPPSGKKIFIIHGHDELNTHRLTLLLQNQLHVDPLVIISKPGMSRPLIEKYEDNASLCSFAFAIVTPDDEIKSHDGNYRQARPNVIFELGWFVGRLGKHRVTILLKEGTQIHSDIDGISRIQFRDNVEEKFLQIQGELTACGLI